MEDHLTDNQIETLLGLEHGCADAGSDAQRASNAHKSAERHLAGCEHCQAKLERLQAAADQLASLRMPGSGRAGPACPPADVWFQIAAGFESGDAESYLNHAIHCDECGQLLTLAAEDYSEELTAQEEVQMAALASSSAAWQMKLAAKLQVSGAAKRVDRPNTLKFSKVRAHFTPSRIAFAASFLAAVVLGLQDYHLQEHLTDRAQQNSAEIHRLELSTAQQQAQITGLPAPQSIPAPAGTSVAGAGVERNSAVQAAPRNSIASLTLDSGLTRGSGAMKRLSIPDGIEIVKVTLNIPQAFQSQDFAGMMHEELLTVDGRKLWSQELQPSAAEIKAGSLLALVPAYLLSPDDYMVRVSRETPAGTEEVASYSFRVPR